MKKLNNKTVLAAAIAMSLTSTVFAGSIPTGTTGYASQIINGKEVVLGRTFNTGVAPTTVAELVSVQHVTTVQPTDMPVELQTLNQDSVVKVEFDTKSLKALKKGDIAGLDFLGDTVNAKVLNTETYANGDHSMVASTGVGERAIITFGSDGSVVGTATVDGHNYSVSTDVNGGTWIVDNTTSGATHAGFENDTKQAAPVSAATIAKAPLPTPIPKPVVLTPSTTVSNVSLLVYVSDAVPNGVTVANNMVAVANQAYVDSGIKMKVTATKIVVVTDPLPNDTYSDLLYLASGLKGFSTLASDKLAAQADLVTFIHPLKVKQGVCGLGYVNGANGAPYTKNGIYNVVSYGQDSGYYCNNYTLAHELGHNMGMVHDVAHSLGSVGHYPDAYGYGLQNAYGDIMSYFPVNGVFSTPNKYWMNNSRFPYGVINKADVTRGLSQAAPEIALFHTLTK